jgi:hypothetical protein
MSERPTLKVDRWWAIVDAPGGGTLGEGGVRFFGRLSDDDVKRLEAQPPTIDAVVTLFPCYEIGTRTVESEDPEQNDSTLRLVAPHAMLTSPVPVFVRWTTFALLPEEGLDHDLYVKLVKVAEDARTQLRKNLGARAKAGH